MTPYASRPVGRSVEEEVIEMELEYRALPPWRRFIARWTVFIAAGVALIALLVNR